MLNEFFVGNSLFIQVIPYLLNDNLSIVFGTAYINDMIMISATI